MREPCINKIKVFPSLMVSFFSSFKYSRLVSVSYGCNFKVCHPDVCVTNEREESVVNQHNIFLNKLC